MVSDFIFSLLDWLAWHENQEFKRVAIQLHAFLEYMVSLIFLFNWNFRYHGPTCVKGEHEEEEENMILFSSLYYVSTLKYLNQILKVFF